MNTAKVTSFHPRLLLLLVSIISIRFSRLIIAVPESYDVNALVIGTVVHLTEVYRYVSVVRVSSQRLSVDAKQSAHFLDAIPSLKVHIWLHVGHCHSFYSTVIVQSLPPYSFKALSRMLCASWESEAKFKAMLTVDRLTPNPSAIFVMFPKGTLITTFFLRVIYIFRIFALFFRERALTVRFTDAKINTSVCSAKHFCLFLKKFFCFTYHYLAMSGKELKEILAAEGINLSELAKKLGFANDQRLHSALRADDVKSGLIESIAKATNKSVGYFYKETTSSTVESLVMLLADEIEKKRAAQTK